ncbi:MAG: hypothetical protein HFH38_04950 [Lachnospiraceae bacterium]|jgi:hypothetical protein|nr:hypothetical protein [Lachnospiraceae bacterium]
MPPTKSIEAPGIAGHKGVGYTIGVNGDSMGPGYDNGDALPIGISGGVGQGGIGIFLTDGESYVKKPGDGELIPLSIGYSNIPLTEAPRCMGKVIGGL